MKTISEDNFTIIINENDLMEIKFKEEIIIGYFELVKLMKLIDSVEDESPIIFDISGINGMDVSALDYACSENSVFCSRKTALVARADTISAKYITLIQSQFPDSDINLFYDIDEALVSLEAQPKI